MGLLIIPFSTASGQPFRSNLPFSNQPQIQTGNTYSNWEYAKTDTAASDTAAVESGYPDPESVLYKSLIIPGWGQVVNKQVWKVPIVYGLLGGLAWYSVYLTTRYHDYRAAYYNRVSDQSDLRFGPTPGYISPGTSPDQLKSTRNRLRNRRDFIYIAMGLAYGLNAVDAYVFAHMKSFDVSDDLSARARVRPEIFVHSSPGVTLTVELVNRSNNR